MSDFADLFSRAHLLVAPHRIRIHAGPGDRVAEAEVQGYVAEQDPTGIAVGLASDAWKWTVRFAAKDWPHESVRIDRGAIIDADPSPARRWPRLTVQRSWVLEGVRHLECSSEEVA